MIGGWGWQMGLLVIQSFTLSLPTSGWGWGWRGTPHDISRVGARQEMREALELSHHSPAPTSSRQGTQRAAFLPSFCIWKELPTLQSSAGLGFGSQDPSKGVGTVCSGPGGRP